MATVLPRAAHASFDINPITMSLAPAGAKAIGSYAITNTSDHKVPVQIYIVPREPTLDGKEEYKEVKETDEQFQIYPSQLILNPGEKRTVRVSWLGTTSVKSELSYRMISEELPFDVEDPSKSSKKFNASVKIASRYIGSIYITPMGAQPNLAVKAQPDPDAPKQLRVDVTNTGSAHLVLQKVKVKLSSVASKNEVELSTEELKTFYNQNVLAGKTRRFTMPWPKSLPAGPVKVGFEVLKD
jgi:fimbrial chaperone protein